MATFTLFQVLLFSLVALAGTAVALTRNPKRQLFIAGIYGLLQATLFYMLHSPDVALSELTVGAIGLPMLVLLTLAKLEKAK
jgi:energy-converting hydrogenase B subunit D